MRTPEEILEQSRTIAVVGASPQPWRPSFSVMRYLLAAGYRVFPVNPTVEGEILGRPVAPSLAAIPEPIDLVDVFRRVEHAADVARDAAAAAARALWLQLGIRSDEARSIAVGARLDYVEDACTSIVHARMKTAVRG